MRLFGQTEKKVIGSRHGEKLYETLMTREERLRATDMGHYFRISPDARGLNYDKFYVEGQTATEADEAYTSHNTHLLDVDGVVAKILTTDYVREELEGRPHVVEA
jgi:UDP-glucose 4-epimerase